MIPGRAESEGKVDLSLAEAFVKFLETESTPKTPIRLPVEEMTEDATRRSRKSSASSSTTPSLDVSDAINSSSTVPKSGSPNPLVMAGNSGLSASAMPSLPTFSVNRCVRFYSVVFDLFLLIFFSWSYLIHVTNFGIATYFVTYVFQIIVAETEMPYMYSILAIILQGN